jgi:hypothetical protein
MPTIITEFIHEIIIAALIGALMWPWKKIKTAYEETSARLEAVHTELSTQRNNCLRTLQDQGDKQIEILGKVANTLGEMSLDQRATLEVIRDRKA